MRIYVAGIGGVAMGPLAMIARDMGHEIIGSNNIMNDLSDAMSEDGFDVRIGQDGSSIREVHEQKPIDWFIYTAALPEDHPELNYAITNNIRTSKRDEFINTLLEEKDLKMLAIGGTHGKTNTTGMVVWCLQQAGIPVSYSIGARINFGAFGKYEEGSQYFVYEADEFDRNMLKYEPATSVVLNIDFDHPDTYDDHADYNNAFAQFIDNSQVTYIYNEDADKIQATHSPGVHTIEKDPQENSSSIHGLYIRQNARLVIEMLTHQFGLTPDEATTYVNSYPGTARRMEKLGHNIYTDYAHHPDEIRAAVGQALEISPDVTVIYQPHQNIRQHEVQDIYGDCFAGAKKVYWLPTYLSREADSGLEILEPKSLIAKLADPSTAEPAKMNEELKDAAIEATEDSLVLCLSAGDLDTWAREQLV